MNYYTEDGGEIIRIELSDEEFKLYNDYFDNPCDAINSAQYKYHLIKGEDMKMDEIDRRSPLFNEQKYLANKYSGMLHNLFEKFLMAIYKTITYKYISAKQLSNSMYGYPESKCEEFLIWMEKYKIIGELNSYGSRKVLVDENPFTK